MTGICLRDFDRDIVAPVLKRLGLDSLAARRLLAGTALTESGLRFLVQLGGGPGVGVYQMEPATHADIWKNYLHYRPELAGKIAVYACDGLPRTEQMAGNLYYATALARVHYRRAKPPLPDAENATALAQYHKDHYNTALGKTDVAQSLKFFVRAVAEIA